MQIIQHEASFQDIHFEKAGITITFSYTTPVAVCADGWIKTKAKFSNTTSRHMNKHLSSCMKEVEQNELEIVTDLIDAGQFEEAKRQVQLLLNENEG